MKYFVPDYYNKFKCIADRCKHNCCIGWEIDIDSNTYEHYMAHNGALKTRFGKCISTEDAPHFILDKDERCPFLSDKNLCDIYCEMGEASLCQICSDHPRFRNFFSDRTETGLGLCCEEACRIILTEDYEFNLVETDDDGIISEPLDDDELWILKERQGVIDIFLDTTKSFDERFEALLGKYELELYSYDFEHLYKKLEYMNSNVYEMLKNNDALVKLPDTYLQRLAVYFSYRHITDYLYDEMFYERLLFVYFSVKAIEKMCTSNDTDEICDKARIYSSEIEYSEDNMKKLLCEMGDMIEIPF